MATALAVVSLFLRTHLDYLLNEKSQVQKAAHAERLAGASAVSCRQYIPTAVNHRATNYFSHSEATRREVPA